MTLVRITGVTAALVSAAVTLLMLLAPLGGAPNPPRAVRTLSGLLVLSLLAAYAAARERPWWMIALFVPMFVPLGFYFLGAPSYVAATGVSHLVYLACGVIALVHAARRQPMR